MEIVPPPALNIFERINRWIQESIMVKLFSIGFLILVLLIPSSWIQDLIYERQHRATDVIQEIAHKWSGSQTISGPILVIPYTVQDVVRDEKGGKQIREYTQKAFFLPDVLDIKGKVDPEILHRGIFESAVYKSGLSIHSTFQKPDFKSLSIPEDKVLWKDAYLVFGITDLRGIADSATFKSGDKTLVAEPSDNIGVSIKSSSHESTADEEYVAADVQGSETTGGIVAKLHWDNSESFEETVTAELSLKGSRRMDFVPTGKTTSVQLSGSWSTPSFDGEFLPSQRDVSEAGFTASWKVLHFNRPFSQQWTGSDQALSGSDFGVKLLIPVDQYQKSIRTSKYGVLIILLTFIALFLVEITQKIRIHPFQYILIGAALTIYYTLLLSISEHIGYNIAYGIASLATVLLIAAYSTSFLEKRFAILFSLLLVVFYGFVFVIILQQDLSLLIGSIGLFIIVGLLMYFSRKIKWYQQATA